MTGGSSGSGLTAAQRARVPTLASGADPAGILALIAAREANPASAPPLPPAAKAKAKAKARAKAAAQRRRIPMPPLIHAPPPGQEQHPADRWIRGTFIRDSSEAARTTDGVVHTLMTWNGRTGQFNPPTRWGLDYYANNRVEFLVELRCIAYQTEKDTHGRWRTWKSPNSNYEPRYIPIDEDTLEQGYDSHQLQELLGIGLARDLNDPNHAQEAISALVHDWLNSPARTRDDEGNVIVARESPVYWVWDGGPIQVSQRNVRHLYAGAPPLMETLMHRPLRGKPTLNAGFYRRMDLMPIACEDLKDRGGCVFAQLLQCTRTVRKQSGRKRVNGKWVGGTSEQVKVKLFESEQLRGWVTDAQNRAYKTQSYLDLLTKEPFEERPYPYETDNWDDGVGMTSEVVKELIKERRMKVIIVYSRCRCATFLPEDYDARKDHNIPIVCFSINGDHAFFYDNPDAFSGASQLKEMSPLLQMDKEEPQRLRCVLDDDDVATFGNPDGLPWYDPDAVLRSLRWQATGEETPLHYFTTSSLYNTFPPLVGVTVEEREVAHLHMQVVVSDGTHTVEVDVYRNGAVMVPYSLEFLCAHYEECEEERSCQVAVMYIHQDDLERVGAELASRTSDMCWSYWFLAGSKPDETRGFAVERPKSSQKSNQSPDDRVRERRSKPILIRVVPSNARMLERWCLEFQERTELTLPYRGDGLSGLMNRAADCFLAKRRRLNPMLFKREVIMRQKSMCNCCGDLLKGRCELDHVMPLSAGGENAPENLQALCPPCHAEKTRREQESRMDHGVSHVMQSELSPTMVEKFHKSPKPVEISWGSYDRVDKAISKDGVKQSLGPKRHIISQANRIKDSKERQAAARKLRNITEVKALDVVGCRVNALVQSEFGLPIFAPTDEPEAVDLAALSAVEAVAFVKRRDFFYLDMGVDRIATFQKARDDEIFPYNGARWYWKEVVIWLLETGRIEAKHVKAAWEASRHLDPDKLKSLIDDMRAAWDKTACYFPESDIPGLSKRSILSMIGLWNCNEQYSWRKVRSTHEADAGGNVRLKRHIGDGVWEFHCSTEILSNQCSSPWGRISLCMEQLRVAQARLALRRHREIYHLGDHVDASLFVQTSFNWAALEQELLAPKYRDGTPIYQVKEEPLWKLPSWSQKPQKEISLTFETKPWEHLVDPTVDAVVARFRENGGLYINGPPGTGKSYLLEQIIKALKVAERGVKIYVAAVRLNAAAIVGGKTLSHYANRFNRSGRGAPPKNAIIVADEVSDAALSWWSLWGRWQMVGVRFILVGDMDGQLPPVYDQWDDARRRNDTRQSELMKRLCGYTKVSLTVDRRSAGDAAHFQFYSSMYPSVDLPDVTALEHLLYQCIERYPKQDGVSDLYLVMSHKKRLQVNAAVNKVKAAEQPSTLSLKRVPVPGCTMDTQDMLIWQGQLLLGCVRKSRPNGVTHGVIYIVEDFDDHSVTVVRHPQYAAKSMVEPEPAALAEPADPAEDEEEEEGEEGEEDAAATAELEAQATAKNYRMKLSHAKAAQDLRLTHCLCIASVQGMTWRDAHVTLLDLNHRYLTVRHLIVATSRVTAGKYLHCLSSSDERDLMRSFGQPDGGPVVASRGPILGWQRDEVDLFPDFF
jgi:hypothetical protein